MAADGSLTLTSLADNTEYFAYASVGGQDRYVHFSTGNPAAVGADQGSPGSAAPAEAEQVAGSDGTNLRTLRTDATGALLGPGTGAASYGTISVGTSATQIVAANASRTSVLVVNNDPTKTLYVGKDSSVTTANGIPVAAGQAFSEDSAGQRVYTGAVYGIVGTGSLDARFWEGT